MGVPGQRDRTAGGGRHHAGIGIDAAYRVGVPAFRAARVKQEVVKVPEHEVVVALVGPQPAVAGRVELEQNSAFDQQGEQLDPGKAVLPAEPLERLRRRQHGEGGGNLRIADPEQRAGARRFQHHVVAAPAQIREPRQDEHVGLAELRRSAANSREPAAR